MLFPLSRFARCITALLPRVIQEFAGRCRHSANWRSPPAETPGLTASARWLASLRSIGGHLLYGFDAIAPECVANVQGYIFIMVCRLSALITSNEVQDCLHAHAQSIYSFLARLRQVWIAPRLSTTHEVKSWGSRREVGALPVGQSSL